MTKKRKQYTAEEKVAILRQHLLEKKAVSDICDEYGLQPTVFYRWQRAFFEDGALVFARKGDSETAKLNRQVVYLEGKLSKKNEVLSEVMEEYVELKKDWGTLKDNWVKQEVRDQVVDFVRYWAKRAELRVGQLVSWLGIRENKYYEWQKRYGQANQHNGQIPRDFWLQEWEKAAILTYQVEHADGGYRRLAYMMLDADVVAVSPSSVYRILKEAGRLNKWAKTASKKGTGFNQPQQAHRHWHIDIAYLNICGTFYYLCTILDGYSRYVVHWEIRKQTCGERSRTYDRDGCGGYHPAGAGEVSPGQTQDYLRQWAAVYSQRF